MYSNDGSSTSDNTVHNECKQTHAKTTAPKHQQQQQQCVSHTRRLCISFAYFWTQSAVHYVPAQCHCFLCEASAVSEHTNDDDDERQQQSDVRRKRICVCYARCTETVTHSCYAMPSHSSCLNVWRFDRKYCKRMKWNKVRLTADFLLLLLLFCCHSSSSRPNLYICHRNFHSHIFTLKYLCTINTIEQEKKHSYACKSHNALEASNSAQHSHRTHFFA